MRILAEQFMYKNLSIGSVSESRYQWVIIFDGEATYKFQGAVCILTTKDSVLMLSTASGPIRLTKVES